MPKRLSSDYTAASSGDVLRHPSIKRAKEVDSNTPYDQLLEALSSAKTAPSSSPQNVLHWFRNQDIRAEDNKALRAASDAAQKGSGILISCYVFSPDELKWQGTGPARADFLRRNILALQERLHGMNIPLVIIATKQRKDIVSQVVEFAQKHDVSDVFGNFEYEVDELARDKLALQKLDKADISFQLFHDQTVIDPLVVQKRSGGPLKVFTPFHHAWLDVLAANKQYLELAKRPNQNPDETFKDHRDLFESEFPELPEELQLEKSVQDRLSKMWPAGHEEAKKRLDKFVKSKIKDYGIHRSNPSMEVCSRLSAYFSQGVISAREALVAAQASRKAKNFSESSDGVDAWARELVFREFYRQMMIITPHMSMNLPQNLKFNSVKWEQDEDGWKKWCDGTTGMPFIDAGMRQLKAEAYMHNRLRMNVASYLRMNLLIDYRRGERFFAENLVDWDLCNNSAGWEPSYTSFNPVLQAEKNDPDGSYIRKWVPELRDVKGKAVFDPYNRLPEKEFEKLGYHKPHVDFAETKQRAVDRYKEGLRSAQV